MTRRLSVRLRSVGLVAALAASIALVTPTASARPVAGGGAQNLIAIVASHAKNSVFNPIGDLLVARVGGAGAVRVLGTHRVLQGRLSLNPQWVRIAPKTHQIAFVFSNDADGLIQGLAVVNADGSHLRVLIEPGQADVIWDVNWDVSGKQLLVSGDADSATFLWRLDTRQAHPKRLRTFVTHTGLLEASFVGSSISTFLVHLYDDQGDSIRLIKHGHSSVLRASTNALLGPASSPSGLSFIFSEHAYPGGPWAIKTATFAHPGRVHTVATVVGENAEFSPAGNRIFYSGCDCTSGGPIKGNIRWVWFSGSASHRLQFHAGYNSYDFGGIVSA